MKNPLKILMILHMPWSRNLGGARVQLELAEEFQLQGHHVEKFDFHDAFPNYNSSRFKDLIRPSFSIKAKAFVRSNGHRFDIIDAHQGNLPFTKKELGFKGLLVARSVGLYSFYDEFAKQDAINYPPRKIKTHIGNFLRSRRAKRELPNFPLSLQTCDLINVCNHDELKFVRDELELGHKCAVLPFGLSDFRQQAFAQAAQPASLRLANKKVTFIGSWGRRKGSNDWPEIIRLVKSKVPNAKFLFLGTGYDSQKVLSDLNLSDNNWVQVVPNYNSEALPGLLSDSTIGAFPSYIEGFGFAILEKLASGLPTVAYDVPGPREMLSYFDTSFMVSPGNVEEFSNRLIDLLKLDTESYTKISRSCIEVSNKFCWNKIAQETTDIYHKYFSNVD